MYKSATYNIFVQQGKSNLQRGLKWIKNWISPDSWTRTIARQPQLRSQDGLKEELNDKFGDTRLQELAPGDSNNHCIAAAVASEFNEDASNPDKVEIFDTTNENQRFFWP